MHYSSTSLALILVATIVMGCSTQPLSPAGPSAGGITTGLGAEQIAGTWTLLSVESVGQAEQPVPAAATYAITFAKDRVSTKADCNVCAGGLSVGGETLTIGPLLACTRAACSTMHFETTYVAILAGDSAARIDGSSLTLTSSRGVLRFRR